MFTTEDRFNPGRITAGFHKVGPTDSTRMTFTLNYFEVTASMSHLISLYNIMYVYPILEEGPGLDFDGKPHNISFSTSQSTDVQLSVYVDSIALEPDEMFAIVLSPVSPLSITGEGVFFIDTTCITIRDGDSKCTITEMYNR